MAHVKLARAETLRALWSKLSEHSIITRATMTPVQFFDAIQDINFFLIENSPFLVESEKDLARQYLAAIYELRAQVDESRNELAREALAASMELHTVGQLSGAIEMGVRAQALGDELVRHVKSVAEGKEDRIDLKNVERAVEQKIAIAQTVSARSSLEREARIREFFQARDEVELQSSIVEFRQDRDPEPE